MTTSRSLPSAAALCFYYVSVCVIISCSVSKPLGVNSIASVCVVWWGGGGGCMVCSMLTCLVTCLGGGRTGLTFGVLDTNCFLEVVFMVFGYLGQGLPLKYFLKLTQQNFCHNQHSDIGML